MPNATLPVDDLIQLAKESLRLFSELERSGVPVSPTTKHALLNEATLAIEAIRTTVHPPEKPSETLARLAPWAEVVIPIAPTVAAPAAQEPAPKRHRRTKAEMEADAAAEAAAKKALAQEPPVAQGQPSAESQGGLSGVPAPHFDEPPIAVTNPMPIEAAKFLPADDVGDRPTVAVPIVGPDGLAPETSAAKTDEPTQPGYDREKAEAVLKKTGDAFRASQERRLAEQRAATAAGASQAAVAAAMTAPPINGTPHAIWKDKLHLAQKPEDATLPFKNGDYAHKKFSECSIRDLEIVLANYIRGVEGESDPEKRAERSLWLERGASWHRYRFDLLLINAGDLDMQELRAEYKQKAEAPATSTSMQLHRKLWLDRLEEIDKAKKEAGA